MSVNFRNLDIFREIRVSDFNTDRPSEHAQENIGTPTAKIQYAAVYRN